MAKKNKSTSSKKITNVRVSKKKNPPKPRTPRTKTGISGFDELVEGGFPKGFSILIAGTPGTGKTLFATEFIYNGAAKYNEKGLYISFEQSESDIFEQADRLGFNLKQLSKQGKVKVMYIPVKEMSEITIDKIKKEALRGNYKRLVIDSLSTLSVNAPVYRPVKDIALKDLMNNKSFFSPPILGDFVVKRFIYSFLEDLRNIDHVTTLLISEASRDGQYLSRDTISEFASDGVITINFEAMGGEFARSLIVRKMRKTKNDEDIHPLEISNNGLIIHTVK